MTTVMPPDSQAVLRSVRSVVIKYIAAVHMAPASAIVEGYSML